MTKEKNKIISEYLCRKCNKVFGKSIFNKNAKKLFGRGIKGRFKFYDERKEPDANKVKRKKYFFDKCPNCITKAHKFRETIKVEKGVE